MKKCPDCGFEAAADSIICMQCGFDFADRKPKTAPSGEIFFKEIGPLKEKLFEKYQIVEFLGKGGFSTVFKLKDKLLNRFCALKILSKELLIDDEMVERFKREARIYASLDHPNIVQVFEVGFYNDVAFIIMKYIDGLTLKDYILKNKPLSLTDITAIATDIASILAYMHQRDIIHRDIKPSNVMVQNSDKRAILTDFGLAKSLNTTTFTVSGKLLGTPYYISPEQASGETVDQRTDIYSLGITIYEMALGDVPFKGETPLQIALKHITEEFPRPTRIKPDLEPNLEALILKATKKEPKKRYQHMEQMIADLEKIGRNLNKKEPFTLVTDAPKKKNRWLIAGFVILAFIIVGFFLIKEIARLQQKQAKTGDSPIQQPARMQTSPSQNQQQINILYTQAQQLLQKSDYQKALENIAAAKKIQSTPEIEILENQIIKAKESANRLIAEKREKPQEEKKIESITFTELAKAQAVSYAENLKKFVIPDLPQDTKVLGQITLTLGVKKNGRLTIETFDDYQVIVTPTDKKETVKSMIGSIIENLRLVPPLDRKGKSVRLEGWRVAFEVGTFQGKIILNIIK